MNILYEYSYVSLDIQYVTANVTASMKCSFLVLVEHSDDIINSTTLTARRTNTFTHQTKLRHS